jgi:hypothetical protein
MPNRHQPVASSTQKNNAEEANASNTPSAYLDLTAEERQMLERIISSTTKSPVEINQEIFRFWMAKRQQSTEDAAE